MAKNKKISQLGSVTTMTGSELAEVSQVSVSKKISWTQIKAFLKTYFDTIYTAIKAQQTLTSSTTIAMNVNSGQNAYLSLGHTGTLTLSNLVAGNEGNIVIDNTGSYTLTISPTPYVINDGGGDIALAASSRTILSYYYDGTALNITKGETYTNA